MTPTPPTPGHTSPGPPVISPAQTRAAIARSVQDLAGVLVDLEFDHDAGHLDLTEELAAVAGALFSLVRAQSAAEILDLADDPPARTTVTAALRLAAPVP